jgi:hypothetical protein
MNKVLQCALGETMEISLNCSADRKIELKLGTLTFFARKGNMSPVRFDNAFADG